jgi:hypothetical protein
MWADLVPNETLSPFEQFLSNSTPEVIAIPSIEVPDHVKIVLEGHIGRSRFNVAVALSAALAAAVVGVRQVELRHKHTYAQLVECGYFDTDQELYAWKHGPVTVTIVASYTAMVEVTRKAVELVLARLSPQVKDQINIVCASADALQGDTLEYMVLALPPDAATWSEWQSSPSRLLTIFSRYRWQLAMTYVDCGEHTSEAVKIVKGFQKRASEVWPLKDTLTTLDIRYAVYPKLWQNWVSIVTEFTKQRSLTVSEVADPAPTRSAETASASQDSPFSSTTCYRGHNLLLLRYRKRSG